MLLCIVELLFMISWHKIGDQYLRYYCIVGIRLMMSSLNV